MLTNTICGMRVAQTGNNDKLRNLGKVRSFVFHPKRAQVVGILVKRPDAALMFHRKDVFVRFGAFSLDAEGSGLVVDASASATGPKAARAAGVSLDDCVLWWGMPVVNEHEQFIGYVDNVCFSWKTGAVSNIEVGVGGVASAALKGKVVVNASDILGYSKSAEEPTGAILVSASVTPESASGGLVEKAGKATAVTKSKVNEARSSAKQKVAEKANITPESAGEAVNKASYAAGEKLGSQLTKTKGMFKNFKEEFDKAYKSED